MLSIITINLIYADTGIDRACSPSDDDYVYKENYCFSDDIKLLCSEFPLGECYSFDEKVTDEYNIVFYCKNESFSRIIFYETTESNTSYFFNSFGEMVGATFLLYSPMCCDGQTSYTVRIGTTGDCIEDTDTGTDDPACGCASAPANPWLIGLFFTTFLLLLRRRVPVHALPEDTVE